MLNCDARAYGAAGDGQTMDTAAIQTAIDDCGAHGGGRVTLSDGVFLSGRIDLRSGVELRIERDAVLLGSKNGLDFPEIETAPFCERDHTLQPYFRHVENLSLADTAFSVL